MAGSLKTPLREPPPGIFCPRGPSPFRSMSGLRLFDIPAEVSPTESSEAARGQLAEPAEAALHTSERYLAQHIERYGDLAVLQAVLSLLGATKNRQTVDDLIIDRTGFPRCAGAVDRARALLRMHPSDTPDGFWPSFLLRQVGSR